VSVAPTPCSRAGVTHRATWRLASGREITRTVKREVEGDPTDEERRAIVLREFLEELQERGNAFPEGHGALLEVLGAMTD
jgi:hypothetical protein